MQRFLDELEIAEEQLVGKEYKIRIAKVFGDFIFGLMYIQEKEYNFEYNCNSKILTINEEEKNIQWLKDVIKCYSSYQKDRIELTYNNLCHDILINDEDEYVRAAVAATTTNEKYLEILAKDEYYWVRRTIAERGYFHGILINDEDYKVRIEVAEKTDNEKYLEILAKDKDCYTRAVIAKRGYYHDILINDKDYEVRAAVAETTNNEKYIEILANDKDWRVRYKIANRGLYHDILIDDENDIVRKGIAKTTNNEKYLEMLSKDKEWEVREVTARRGYGLDILSKSVGEGSKDIKRACKNFMKANSIKGIGEYRKDKEKWYEYARTNILKY